MKMYNYGLSHINPNSNSNTKITTKKSEQIVSRLFYLR